MLCVMVAKTMCRKIRKSWEVQAVSLIWDIFSLSIRLWNYSLTFVRKRMGWFYFKRDNNMFVDLQKELISLHCVKIFDERISLI